MDFNTYAIGREIEEALNLPDLKKRYNTGEKYFKEVLSPLGFSLNKRSSIHTLEKENQVWLSGETLIDLFDRFHEIKNDI